MTYTIPLSQLSKKDIPSAGGKGANLGQLTTADFPVPSGFVLTTAAYNAFVQAHDLQGSIIELTTSQPTTTPAANEEAAAAINKLFLERDLPQAIEQDLRTAYAALTAENGDAVAVRSSATAEDLPQASFAGQQETFLNVRGPEALLQAVNACWASLWTARAIAYRQRLRIDHREVSMAVIVQLMVPAELSGVLFTANPTSGARDELLINASYGLGEAIVSGQVTPDSYLLNRSDLAVKASTLGKKELMITPDDDQGSITQDVPTAQQGIPTLSPARLTELGETAVQVEALFSNVPQDIEWAWDGDQFWLLQARPITNLPPAPLKDVRWEPVRPGTIWMRRQVVEHMPEPLSPLFDELYLQEGLDLSMSEMTVFMSDLSGLHIDVWEFIDPPFAASINGFAYSIASFNMSRKMVPYALRIYIQVLPKMIRHLMPRWKEDSLPRYRHTITYWKKFDLDQAGDEELLQGIRQLAHEDAVYWFAAAVPLGLARMSDAALNGFLKLVSKRLDPTQSSRLISGSFLRGFPSQAASAQIELEAVARMIDEAPDLRQQVLAAAAQDLPVLLAGHPDGQEASQAFQGYLDRYGHQIYNLDFAAPTLADDPLPVLLSLQTAVAHPERDARKRQEEMSWERTALESQTKQALNPIQRWIFQRLLSWAQRYAPLREEALFYVGAAWPALRGLAHELGRRLAAAGSLFAADDVFYLRTAELQEASVERHQGNGRPDLAQLARERRELHEARKRLDPPVVVPAGGRMKFGPIDMAFFEPKPRAASTGPQLNGFGVSPGRVTAPASIIRSPADFNKMEPDSILVCTSTTPAWTPLFAQAKGLVTDIGGALAHGSIVAREYGIPAVMGTGEATARIKSGQLIEVDGDAGTVTLVDEIKALGTEQAETKEKNPHLKKLAFAAVAAGFITALIVWWKKRP